MKVKELIVMLQQENQDALVVMSKDSEGNNFSPFYSFGNENTYRAESTWSGETGFDKMTPELREQGYGNDDAITDGEPAVVLYPVN